MTRGRLCLWRGEGAARSFFVSPVCAPVCIPVCIPVCTLRASRRRAFRTSAGTFAISRARLSSRGFMSAKEKRPNRTRPNWLTVRSKARVTRRIAWFFPSVRTHACRVRSLRDDAAFPSLPERSWPPRTRRHGVLRCFFRGGSDAGLLL